MDSKQTDGHFPIVETAFSYSNRHRSGGSGAGARSDGRTIIEHTQSANAAIGDNDGITEEQFNEVLELLLSDSRLDLGGYRRPTIARRIRRRMGLKGAATFDIYFSLLRDDAKERESLTNDLLINVTGFFRDPPAWKAFESQVVASLMSTKEPGSEVRCWVPACSTGEEAYTLAMLLAEQAEAAGKDVHIKIFATDLAKHAIDRARAGVYSAGICAQMSAARLSRFFEKQDDHYRVSKAIRDKVVFTPHNVLTDPPFSHLDIITCRNMLIYLEPETQRKVLGMLHFALRAEGYLMLGSSEFATRDDALFHALDSKYRIYRRIGPARHDLFDFPAKKVSATDALSRIAEMDR